MTTNGYRSDLTCPCGATATFEDANGFLIAGWVREWSELHAKHAKPDAVREQIRWVTRSSG